MRLSPLVGLVLVAAACTPKPAETPAAAPAAPVALSATEIAAVQAVDAAFAAGMNAKDSTAVFAVYAPDAKLMPPDSPILNGAEGHAVITGLIAGGAADFVLTPTLTYGVGDLAYTVGTATFTMGGGPATIKYAEVLRKNAEGKWQYVVDIFSGVAAPAPAKK